MHAMKCEIVEQFSKCILWCIHACNVQCVIIFQREFVHLLKKKKKKKEKENEKGEGRRKKEEEERRKKKEEGEK